MTPAFQRDGVSIFQGDCRDVLRSMPADSVQCICTSPPYWAQRDYNVDGQIGLERKLADYVAVMVDVFRECRRVLHPSGLMFLNIGDKYSTDSKWGGSSSNKNEAEIGDPVRKFRWESGCKPKDACGVPWRVFLALQADGWFWRDTIVWHKPAPMPLSVDDRCTPSWEPIGMFAKRGRYFSDMEAVKEPCKAVSIERLKSGWNGDNKRDFPGGQHNNFDRYMGSEAAMETALAGANKRNVWSLTPEPFDGGHFAVFPSDLPRTCFRIGTSEHGCCPECRAPYKRIVDKTKLTRERPNEYTKRTGQEGTGNSCANTVAGVASRTTGWEPTCKCDAGKPVPCRVLDPFFGSGTTGEVAQELGCECWGIELNAEYIELAAKRFKQRTFLVGA